jgi:hypothetical protein
LTFGPDDRAPADVFTTVTVHLCAGAYAFGLARHGRAQLPDLLTLVRDRLTESVDRLGGDAADVLRERVLETRPGCRRRRW